MVLNRVDDFEATLADVVVGKGVTNTLLLGQEGSLEKDGSSNTVIVPFERKPGTKE